MIHEEKKPTDRPSSYDAVADKIGLVPNVRRKDNLYQGAAVLVTALLGAAIGWFSFGRLEGVLWGLLGGVVVGGLVSGFVLMIVGLVRKA